eukprot:1160994-Pelagomonas_calceolata.AAC.8
MAPGDQNCKAIAAVEQGSLKHLKPHLMQCVIIIFNDNQATCCEVLAAWDSHIGTSNTAKINGSHAPSGCGETRQTVRLLRQPRAALQTHVLTVSQGTKELDCGPRL